MDPCSSPCGCRSATSSCGVDTSAWLGQACATGSTTYIMDDFIAKDPTKTGDRGQHDETYERPSCLGHLRGAWEEKLTAARKHHGGHRGRPRASRPEEGFREKATCSRRNLRDAMDNGSEQVGDESTSTTWRRRGDRRFCSHIHAEHEGKNERSQPGCFARRRHGGEPTTRCKRGAPTRRGPRGRAAPISRGPRGSSQRLGADTEPPAHLVAVQVQATVKPRGGPRVFGKSSGAVVDAHGVDPRAQHRTLTWLTGNSIGRSKSRGSYFHFIAGVCPGKAI